MSTDRPGIEVGVVAWRGDGDTARGLVGSNGYRLAIAQSDGYRCTGWVGQGSGVYDAAAFGDGWRR
ncbi:hypothetical protein D3C76_1749690 [compost metagenome]